MAHASGKVLEMPGVPWEAVTVRSGAEHTWGLGPLDVTVRRTEHEWHLTMNRQPVNSRNGPETETRRWVAQPPDDSIQCDALLPDRPLVIRPEAPLSMPPGREATFYIGIPVWLRLRTGVRIEEVLCELPTAILSRSWFGTPIEGELCYSLRSSLKRDHAGIVQDPNLAVCMISIRNGSPTALHIERVCIRFQDLPVFRGEDRLWTVPARVTYRGEGEWSRIVYGTRAPDVAGKTRRLGEPRKKPARGIVAKTFDVFRTLGEEG